MGPQHGSRGILPGSGDRRLFWIAFTVLCSGVLILWFTNPFLIQNLQEVGSSPIVLASGSSVEDANESLYLDKDDAVFMNRIFREKMNEVAYCGLLRGDQLTPWIADTTSSSPDKMTFSTKNCPGSAMPDAIIHTHPEGRLGLSFADRAFFVERGRKYMCIQGGQIKIVPGQRAKQLACYKKVKNDGIYDFVRVPVIIRSEAAS